jgi:hypothetical protein
MDYRSVRRTARNSTRFLVAQAHLYAQVSTLLLIETKVARQPFFRQPVKEVLTTAERALGHENEAEYGQEKILPVWERKRGRGYWKTEDQR